MINPVSPKSDASGIYQKKYGAVSTGPLPKEFSNYEL